jgi:hypothetical protein
MRMILRLDTSNEKQWMNYRNIAYIIKILALICSVLDSKHCETRIVKHSSWNNNNLFQNIDREFPHGTRQNCPLGGCQSKRGDVYPRQPIQVAMDAFWGRPVHVLDCLSYIFRANFMIYGWILDPTEKPRSQLCDQCPHLTPGHPIAAFEKIAWAWSPFHWAGL